MAAPSSAVPSLASTSQAPRALLVLIAFCVVAIVAGDGDLDGWDEGMPPDGMTALSWSPGEASFTQISLELTHFARHSSSILIIAHKAAYVVPHRHKRHYPKREAAGR